MEFSLYLVIYSGAALFSAHLKETLSVTWKPQHYTTSCCDSQLCNDDSSCMESEVGIQKVAEIKRTPTAPNVDLNTLE